MIPVNCDCSESNQTSVNADALLFVLGCMLQIVTNTEPSLGSPEYVSESHAGSVFESCQQRVQTAHTLHRRGNGGTHAALGHVPPSCQRSTHFQSRRLWNKHTFIDKYRIVVHCGELMLCMFYCVCTTHILSLSSGGGWSVVPGSLSLHKNKVLGYRCHLWPLLPEIFSHPVNRMITHVPHTHGSEKHWRNRQRARRL